jgi:S1-C subfamily serine protease
VLLPAPVSESSDADPEPYEDAVAVGHALGLPDVTVTVGNIQTSGNDFIRMSSPIIFGNSGGGLYVVRRGKLVLAGIVVAVFQSNGSAVYHMGIAIPLSTIRRKVGF